MSPKVETGIACTIHNVKETTRRKIKDRILQDSKCCLIIKLTKLTGIAASTYQAIFHQPMKWEIIVILGPKPAKMD